MSNTSTIVNTLQVVINTPKYYNTFQNVQLLLIKITNPYIFIIGCIGLITNTSTIALLSKSLITKNLRQRWTLIALALSDLVLNVVLLIRVFRDLIGGETPYLCMMISFLGQLAELLSACFTVLFTIQRYTAVRYPIQAAIEKRSPIISLLIILTLSILFCLALTRAAVFVHCHEELALRWFIADALSSFIIPFSLILIFNILIVNLIRKHGRSQISIQSTLSRNGKPGKHARYRHHRKDNLGEEEDSLSCSPTSQGATFATDTDRKLCPSAVLIVNNENINSIKKNQTTLSRVSTDETEALVNETDIPMLPLEVVTAETVSNNRQQSIKSSPTGQRKKFNTTLNENGSPELIYVSNDTVYVNTKEGQTTQSIRVTRMLVLVSTCFLILNAPAHLCVILVKIYSSIDSHVYTQHIELDRFQQTANLTKSESKNFVFIPINNDTKFEKKNSSISDMDGVADDQILIHLLYIAVFLTQLISYASYSINFFLYSFSGVTFRTELRQFLNKLRRR